MDADKEPLAHALPQPGTLLVVCRPGIEPQDFDRLQALLAGWGAEVRWTRRAGRLVLLIDAAPGDPAEQARLSADPAVEYLLDGPSPDEVARLVSRRDLLGVALATTGAMAAGAAAGPMALFFQAPPAQRGRGADVFVGKLDSIPVNGSVSRLVDGEEYVIVRRDETSLHALSATCTHSEVCLVNWDARRRQLICPCHRGTFDLDGNVVSGPPPRPLTRREVVVRQGGVYVRGGAS